MGFFTNFIPQFKDAAVEPCALLLHVKRPYGKKTGVIEIKNTQSFTELDMAIRRIMDYDTWDHCSAFFEGKPWKSECIAEVYPDKSGPGQNLAISSIHLEPDDQLGYVYDLRDNLQHTILVKDIQQVDPTKKYPISALDVAAKNSPKKKLSSAKKRTKNR